MEVCNVYLAINGSTLWHGSCWVCAYLLSREYVAADKLVSPGQW
jgi:hypothetical protein